METNPNYVDDFRPEYRREYVSRVFRTREEADRAYERLRERGYSDDEINVMMSDATRDRYFTEPRHDDTDLGNKVAENAGKGSLIGGGIGAVVGAIAAIGTSVLIPGLGLVVAGPLAAALAGAGAGGVAGGLIGALTGAGVPEDEAVRYKKDIEEGGIYVGFQPRNEDDARYMYDEWYER
ncbi:MAG: hypothetical protein Q4G48_01620 [Bacteroidia bacterium]|nr:hypothetical protein [Bacteroidia bacterium]